MLGASEPEFQTMHEIQELSIHDQDFSVPAKEFGHVSKRLNFLGASIQNTCVDVANVHVLVDESRHPLGPNYLTNSEIYNNTEFEEIESLFNITQKLVWHILKRS